MEYILQYKNLASANRPPIQHHIGLTAVLVEYNSGNSCSPYDVLQS